MKKRNRVGDTAKKLQRQSDGSGAHHGRSLVPLLKSGHERERQGDFAGAEREYRRALDLAPDNADAWHLLGVLAYRQKSYEEALTRITRAIDLVPGHADFYVSLTSVYSELGRFEDAATAGRRALELQPDHAMAHNNLANALAALGRTDDAIDLLKRAIALGYPLAASNLGGLLVKRGCFVEALEFLEQAVAAQPDSAAALLNLSVQYGIIGRVHEAVDAARRALALEPNDRLIHSHLIFFLDFDSRADARMQQQERRRWWRDHVVAKGLEPFRSPGRPVLEVAGKLKVGYVSADFWRHSAALTFGPMLRHFDRQRFEVHCYSNSQVEDAVTCDLRGRVDGWRSIADVPDDTVCQWIREDGIHILVDLSAHTAGERLMVFARRPALLQITAWGHANGTGMSEIDVLFSDPLTIPGRQAYLYAEELVSLPCTLTYEPQHDLILPEITALPMLTQGHATFGCFNKLGKVTTASLDLWSDILCRLPESRFLLKASELDNPVARARILAHFVAQGVAAERIELLGRSDQASHMAAHGRADICLDPVPQGGGVSTFESLWMGVPVVCLLGDTHASRLTAGISNAVGLTEWIAASPQDYVRLAVEMAQQPQRLAATRASMRQRLLDTDAGNPRRYVAAVEARYLELWQRKVETRRKAAIFRHETGVLDDQFKAAIAMHQRGALAQAAAEYMRLIERYPNHPDLLHLLGVVAYQSAHHQEAIELIGAAVARNPGAASYRSNLGNAWRDQGNPDRATACYLRAAELDPGNTVIADNLIGILGRLPPAAAAAAVSSLASGDERILKRRALLAAGLRRGDDIAQLVKAYVNTELQQREDVQREYDDAVSRRRAGDLKGALLALQKLIDRAPRFADSHHGMVTLLEGDTDPAQAIAAFRSVLRACPRAQQLHSVIAYSTDFDTQLSAAEQQEERKRWYRQQIKPLGIAPLPLDVDRDPERKLRIGFIPGRYYFNPSACTYLPVLQQLDRRQFEVYCYDNFPTTDDITLAIQRNVDGWCDITSLTDREVAERIRDDRIDILVDLFAHAGANRLPIYEYKPAPIQVTAWGHANGTGMATMDYLFSDPVSIPPEETAFYAETVYYLPCQLSYWLPEQAPPISPLPAARGNGIVFGCFNRMIKISDAVIALWAELLKVFPDARLMLKSAEFGLVEQRIKAIERFGKYGIGPERIILHPGSPWFDHLQHYNEVDIALDAFPMGGGVTTLDALWMGVPVVCLKGHTLGQRITSAIMTAVGLEDWVADSPESYLALAIAKAGMLPELARLRLAMRKRMIASPLGNPGFYVKSVEHAFRSMWRQWCADPLSRLPLPHTAAYPVCDETLPAQALWRAFLAGRDAAGSA